MTSEGSQRIQQSGGFLASIDIGSHTARLLVSKRIGLTGSFRPVLRKRVYTRLAEGFGDRGMDTMKPEAIERALRALKHYVDITRRYPLESIRAVCTGVVRRATNRDHFLNLLQERTGIEAKVISGEEEARLTGEGVLHALNIQKEYFMIFDLGGGSTEFIYGAGPDKKTKSIPLGSVILTEKNFISDPPDHKSIETAAEEVDRLLQEAFSVNPYSEPNFSMIGTGGTVTTLAAVIHDIGLGRITSQRIDGLILKKQQLEDLFSQMKTMTTEQRLQLPGVDRGRADVILAGLLGVLKILYFFESRRLVVSLSDLLEGILLAYAGKGRRT